MTHRPIDDSSLFEVDNMNNVLNKPPSISEDTLEYTIYPPHGSSDRASVTAIAVAIQSFVDYILQGFIWHRDPFELKVVQNLEDKEWMLEGHMRVGDSVDDEWCTVYLLREMSAKWDLVIGFCPYVFLSVFFLTYLTASAIPTESFYSSRLPTIFHHGSHPPTLKIGYAF